MVRSFQLGLVAFVGAVLVNSYWERDASACSRCVWWVTPAGGDVPANLPAIRFGYVGPPLAQPPVRVTELVNDGTERPVGLTFPLGNLARFEQPLSEGSVYRVTHPGCGQLEEFTFRAVAPAPMPSELGHLSIGEIVDDVLSIPSSSSTCSTLSDVRGVKVALTLSNSARPWARALEVEWVTDGGMIVQPGDVFSETPPDPTQRLAVQVCAVVDENGGLSATGPPKAVTVSGSVPGSDIAMAPAQISLQVNCDAGTRSEGCAAGSAPWSWVVFGLTLTVLRRRR